MRLAKTPAILSLVLVTLVGEAAAQGTDVVCRTEFAWMKNSRGQSPCLVAAYLNSACLADPTKSYVESLAAEFHYNPPTRVAATKCQCSTVYYTAISACAACQGNIEDVLPWSTWTLNCTSTGTGTFPGVWPTVVPEGSAIPAWGYMDVVKPDVFNLTLAQQLAAEHQPDTIGVSSTIPAATSTSTSTTAAPSQAMTTAAAESSGSSGSKAKQIVIGTVLGAVILALICVIIVLLVRRARSRSPVRAVVSPTGEKAGLSAGMRLPLYDPSNPATFPAEPFDSSYRSDH